MQYVEIDHHLEQIVKTSAFLAKVKGKDEKIIDMLETQYKLDITNLDNVAAMCFYQWFLADDKLDLADTNSVFQVTFNVLNKLDDVLELKPEYWILWMLKYKIQSFMNMNENDLIDSLIDLRNQQKEGKQMSYYLTCDVLLAHICYTKDRIDFAREVLEEILNTYTEKIKVLTNFFKGYVIEFKNVVLRSGDDDILELLETIQTKYF